MKRQHLEHIIRAAAAITGAREIVIIGSQSVLGQFPNAPVELLRSMEADVFSLRAEADGELIDWSIGEGTSFHQTFGYYAHGVAEETAHLPDGWKTRLIRLENENTGGGIGLCLEAHDLAVSKLIAGREKDVAFLAGLLKYKLVNSATIQSRLESVPIAEDRKKMAAARLARLVAKAT